MPQRSINQEKFAEKCKPLGIDTKDLYDFFITNIKGKTRDALSYVLALSNKNRTIYVSQSRIARKIGSCRETANRAMGYLAELGLITKKYRHMMTCLYTIHPTFLDPEVRDELKTMFKCFYFLNLSFLGSFGLRNTQLEKDSYIFSKKSSSAPEMSHKEFIRNNNIRLYSSPQGVSPGKNDPGRTISDRSLVNLDRNPRRGTMTKRIKTLKLTRVGEIKLSPFPPEAIAEANKQLAKHTKPVKDIFRLYWTFCDAYCKQHNIKVGWREMFAQLEREGFSKDDPGINARDPYIYEERSIDSTSQTKGPRVDPKNVGHSIYHNAQPPAKREPETVEQLNSSKAKLEALKESSTDPFMKDMASIIGSIMDCIKPR